MRVANWKKRGKGTLPQEVLQAIAPPPLSSQPQQVISSPGTVSQDRTTGKNVEEQVRNLEANGKASQLVPLSEGQSPPTEEAFKGEEKVTTAASHSQRVVGAVKEPVPVVSFGKEGKSTTSVKSEQDVEQANQKVSNKADFSADRERALPLQGTALDAAQVKNSTHVNVPTPPKDVGPTRKYFGLLFDFPSFIRRHDSFGWAMFGNNANNLRLACDVEDLLFEEGKEVLSKKKDREPEKDYGFARGEHGEEMDQA